MICSRPRYAVYCLKEIIIDMIGIPAAAIKKAKEESFYFLYEFLKPRNILVRNWRKIRRIMKTDNWGPVWTGLLKKYKVDYRKGDLTRLPYEDGFFDIVSCISVLEHMPFEEMIKGIREMARVVKKGGKLIITYDKKEDLTHLFIRESNMTPIEVVSFSKPNNPLNRLEVVGIYLVKPMA